MTAKQIPLSLRRKSSARVAAVQCLYRLKITSEETSTEALLEDYLAQWKDDKNSSNRVISRDADPDAGVLRKILTGVMERKEELDGIIKASLNEKWTIDRMSPLLTAVLACAIFELKQNPTKAPMVIDEYVTITGTIL